MGVDVSPETVIGISFGSQGKSAGWAMEYGFLEEDYECLQEEIEPPLEYVEFSGYSDEGGVIGISVSPSDLEYENSRVDEVWETLYEEIPEEFHEMIKCYMFSRYH